MRVGVVNGNGCICDKCHEVLLPGQCVNLRGTRLSSDPKRRQYGEYQTAVKTLHLCPDCCKVVLDFIGVKSDCGDLQ